MYMYMNITQYGSTVYTGIAMGSPALFRFHFHFQFNQWLTCEKVTACKEISHKVQNTGKHDFRKFIFRSASAAAASFKNTELTTHREDEQT